MPTRTSITDPLMIDAMPCGNGLVGMTLCPGKHGPSVFGSRWERDLAPDLRAVADWGATALVSLIESPEMSMLGVSNLGDAAEEAGMDWHHLPIKDLNAPDERFERRWTYSVHVLRRKLRAGERVVLHCRGGLGRTGTVAARLAIELGEAPAAALKRVRAARKGAVETRGQEAFELAARCAAQTHSHPSGYLSAGVMVDRGSDLRCVEGAGGNTQRLDPQARCA